jgi:hypothetical protein
MRNSIALWSWRDAVLALVAIAVVVSLLWLVMRERTTAMTGNTSFCDAAGRTNFAE